MRDIGDLTIEAVHPHACGEHAPSIISSDFSTGPSPRVWGTLNRYRFAQSQIRSIPTRVGNTESAHRQASHTPVHPHACGEHDGSDGQGLEFIGPSPRVWGTLWYEGFGRPNDRSIPTRVGNTEACLA